MSQPRTKPTPPFASPKKAPAQPAPLATSTHGKRNHDNGGMTYSGGGPEAAKKAAYGLILVSRILRKGCTPRAD